MELLKENRKILEERYGDCIEKLEQIKIPETVQLYPAKNGDQVIGIRKNDRIWYLNSRLNPEYAAGVYANRYQFRILGTYFIFGMSDGKHIRNMLEKCDSTNRLIVYEPDRSLFYLLCCSFYLNDIIGDKRVLLYVPKLIGNMDNIINKTVSHLNQSILEMCILPGYDILYREDYIKYEDEVIAKIRDSLVMKQTKLGIGRKTPQYTLYHMKNIVYHSDCEQLRRKLSEYDLGHIPAIIVSAGPSLDKNICELKKAQGKSFVIVVDAALKTVIKAGIRPDMVYTVDFQAPDYFFEGISLNGIIWMCERLSKPWILDQPDSKVFYSGYFCKYYSLLSLNTIGYVLPNVPSGGSVSTDAFSLACFLGFKKIILVGQDLAFTNGISHTKEALGAFGDNQDYIKSRYIVQVKGIDGHLLDTDYQMWLYKNWFEEAIQFLEGKIKVINATEGGANIEGAENRRLSDVIKQECIEKLDIYNILKEIPPAFTKEERNKALLELANMKKYTMELREQVNCAIENQKALIKLLEQGCVGGIREKLMDMTKHNGRIGTHIMYEFIMMYMLDEEYESGSDVYEKEDMDVEELVKRNMNLYRGYQKVIDMLEEDIEEYIIKDRH